MIRPIKGDTLTIKAIHPEDDYSAFRKRDLIGAEVSFISHVYGPEAYEHEGETYWRCYVQVVDDIKRTFKVGVSFKETSLTTDEPEEAVVPETITKRYTHTEFQSAVGELDL